MLTTIVCMVCIKARPHPASLAIIGRITKHIIVKWPITNTREPCSAPTNVSYIAGAGVM